MGRMASGQYYDMPVAVCYYDALRCTSSGYLSVDRAASETRAW